MPLPMVTVMASGKSVAGKLRCVKEFLIAPASGMPLLDVCSSLLSRVTYTSSFTYCVASLYSNELLHRERDAIVLIGYCDFVSVVRGAIG